MESLDHPIGNRTGIRRNRAGAELSMTSETSGLVRSLNPSDWPHVVWNFFRSESRGSLPTKAGWKQLPRDLVDKIAADRYTDVTTSEHATLERVFLYYRAGLASGLKATRADWFTGDLTSSDAPRLKVLSLEKFRRVAPHLTVGEFAAAADSGVFPADSDFGEAYTSLRPDYDPAKTVGLPVLVALGRERTHWIAEGLTRLTCLVSMIRQGQAVPTTIHVLVGYSTNLLSSYPFADGS